METFLTCSFFYSQSGSFINTSYQAASLGSFRYPYKSFSTMKEKVTEVRLEHILIPCKLYTFIFIQ